MKKSFQRTLAEPQNLTRLIFKATVGAALLALFGTQISRAQDDERRFFFQDRAKPKAVVGPPRARANPGNKINRVAAPVRVENRRITRPTGPKKVIPQTGDLLVSTEAFAKVELKPVGAAGGAARPLVKNVPRSGEVEFEDIRPGNYTIVASSKGFYATDSEITIAAGKTFVVNLELEKVKYELNIETNVRSGEVRYAPARLRDGGGATNAGGRPQTVETGGYCIVPIINGKAVIKGIEAGYYNLDVRPEEIEYERLLTVVTPDFLESANSSAEAQDFEIELEKKISTGDFSGSAWTNADWETPAGWRLSSQERTLKTNGIAGIALPRNELYRYYKNFEMVSDVRLTDGDTVGFVLRYVNDKNYYLVQISGERAAEPFNVSTYIVRDGKTERLWTVPNPLRSAVASRKTFRVVIRGKDNVFKIFIEDSATGQESSLGDLVDRDGGAGILRKGAVGIFGTKGSNVEVTSFSVSCPAPCR
jgi:hypothetical protein